LYYTAKSKKIKGAGEDGELFERDYYVTYVEEKYIGYYDDTTIPSGVVGDFFRGYRPNNVLWGRLSL
jgi:hypothetical protein